MAQDVEIKLLCVENDPIWQNRVETASDKEPGINVCTSSTYKDAVKRLENEEYDVCTLDSRLGDRKSHIHQLVKRLNEKSEETRPETLALTNFSRDISQNDKHILFRVLSKQEVGDDVLQLKKTILEASRRSLTRQAFCIWTALDLSEDLPEESIVFSVLKESLAKSPVEDRERAEAIVKKYEIYTKHLCLVVEIDTEVLLDCYGYVSAICENKVEVMLLLRDGQSIGRIFNSGRFLAAGIHYQHAHFHYIITREGAKVNSEIIAEEPPKGYPGIISMPEVDLSVFDRL